MRRSSLWILVFAILLLGLGVLGVLPTAAYKAPPMSVSVAQDVLNRGRAALERRDVDGMMALFTADAKIVGRNTSQIRTLLDQTMSEVGGSPLTVRFSQLEAQPTADGATVSVKIDVSQRTPRAEASYFRPRIHLLLRKETASRFLGLYTVEEWRIYRMDADDTLELPPVERP